MKIDGSALFPKENRIRSQGAKSASTDGKMPISEALKSALLSMGTGEISSEMSVEEKLAQILNNASLENNEANGELVHALLKNKMPINKEMLSTLNMYAKRFPDVDVNHIVFLMKNDMIVSKDSLQYVKDLMNNRVNLSGHIQNLSQEISEHIDSPIGAKIVETMLMDNPEATKVFDKVKQVLVKINPFQILSKMAAKTADPQLKNLPTTDLSQNQIEIFQDSGLKSKPAELISTEGQERKGNQSQVIPIEDEILLPKVMEQESIKEITKIVKQGDRPLFSGVKELFQSISEMELPKEIKDSTHKLLAHRITYAMLKKEFTITEEDLKQNDSIRKYYNKLYQRVVDLLQLNLEDPSHELAKLTKEAREVKNSLEMMNSLQQNYQFLHVPLFLHQQDVDAQLYVMNRKGHAQRDAETVTVLLRLDFRNLKQMDIYVKKEKDQVEMTFYVENEETLSDIKQNSLKLHKALMEKAFRVVGLFVQLKSEDFHIQDDFFNAKSGQGMKQSFTFDAKA